MELSHYKSDQRGHLPVQESCPIGIFIITTVTLHLIGFIIIGGGGGGWNRGVPWRK
jgi:hypothetical protein